MNAEQIHRAVLEGMGMVPAHNDWGYYLISNPLDNNLIHEAEKLLTEEEWIRYHVEVAMFAPMHVKLLLGCTDAFKHYRSAEPLVLAEAWLKAKGLWREE